MATLSAGNVRVLLASSCLVACGSSVDPGPRWRFQEGPCGRGIAVVDSDYASTTVHLLDADGNTRVANVLSSADRPAGLTAALSGDVVLSSMPETGDEIVVLDRETAVVSWVGIDDDSLRQLSVATGFFSNPHDYLTTGDGTALIPRFGENLLESSEDFDRGSDLLVVDPESPEIVGSVSLRETVRGEPDGVRPTPDRAILLGGKIYVTAPSYDRTFESPADSRLVVVDAASAEVENVVVFGGTIGCSSIAASPSGEQLAIVCSGRYGENVPAEQSKLLVLDVTGEPRVTFELSAASLDAGQMGTGVAFVDDDTLLFSSSSGTDDALRPTGRDALHHLRLGNADCSNGDCVTTLHEADPFSLGTLACRHACGRCYGTDASASGGRGGVLVLEAAADAMGVAAIIPVDDPAGLPPRHLSLF